MQMHQLRYVVSAARTGNFSRAAEQCHVSQPSLSQQIKKLEEELGERLFDRMKRSVKLTSHGELFLPRAMRILEEAEAAKREASEARALARGLITIGVLPTIAPYLLPQVLPGFSTAFPGIEIVIQEDTTAQLLALLAAREIDLAIASEPIRDERVQTETLFSEELFVVLSTKHPLVKKKTLRTPDLDSERFIVMKEGHCLGDQVLDFCTRRNFHPRVLCRSAQVETISALVRAGMGISLIPAMARHATQQPQLSYRSLSPPKPHRKVVALWLRDHPLTRAPGAFLHHLRKTVGRGSGTLHSRSQ